MKVIVIGAVAAGSKAAAKLKRLKPDWEILVYTADDNVSYSAGRLIIKFSTSLKEPAT